MFSVNAESDEQLSRNVSQDSMFFECGHEIYPLTTQQAQENQIRVLLNSQFDMGV